MYTSVFMDLLPFWLLTILSILIVSISIEAGWRLGSRLSNKDRKGTKPSISIAVGATMGLLSFLLAFTFGMAAARYDVRQGNVVLEANAVGTVYLRTDFLPVSQRDEARQLLHDYLLIRSGGSSSILSEEGRSKTKNIHDRLWQIGTSAVQQSDSISVGLFIDSLNDMIDMNTSRVTGLQNQLPDNIWLMLTVVTVIAMTSLGFEFGLSGNRRWVGTILLIIAFTTVIILTADLDRPQEGLIEISQQPLLDLLTEISK